MIQQKSFFQKLLMLSLLAVIGFAYACSSTTDPDIIDMPDPDPDPLPEPPPPEIPDGQRAMIIDVFDRSNEPLSGFDIDITGPTSVSADGVGESSFRFEDLESGEYKIVVTLEGYLSEEMTLDVELPEDVKADYEILDVVSLAKLAPPVTVKNDEDNTVEAVSDDPEAGEDEKLVMKIPANTFPPEALDEDGNVQIRVTRAAPSSFTEGEDGGVVSESLVLEPAGVTLNNPIEITIPINAIAGVEYVLQPGNIPLTPVVSKSATPGLTAENRTITEFVGEIESFERFSLVADLGVFRTPQTSEITLDGSECGTDHTISYSTPKIVDTPDNFLPPLAAIALPNYNTLYGGAANLLTVGRTYTNDNEAYSFQGLVDINEIRYNVRDRAGNEQTFTRVTSLSLSALLENCHGN